MEDNIQRVFSILISVIIFFLLPLYMAFEKKDDISYALALKITANFVDNVASKGYLSKQMYEDYISDLSVTANTYDVVFEHVAKKYYPVINTYSNANYDTMEYTDLNDAYFDFKLYELIYNENQSRIQNWKDQKSNGSNVAIDFSGGNPSAKIDNHEHLKLGYKLQEEKYYTDQILKVLEGNEYSTKVSYISPNISNDVYKDLDYSDISATVRLTAEKSVYTMNEGDQFTVIIRNRNTTIASVLFNTLTFGANTGNDTKVYINYGGTIQNMEWKDEDFRIRVTSSGGGSE